MTFLSPELGARVQVPWDWRASNSFCIANCHWGICEACRKLDGSEASWISAIKVKPPEKWSSSTRFNDWTSGNSAVRAKLSFLVLVPVLNQVWMPCEETKHVTELGWRTSNMELKLERVAVILESWAVLTERESLVPTELVECRCSAKELEDRLWEVSKEALVSEETPELSTEISNSTTKCLRLTAEDDGTEL